MSITPAFSPGPQITHGAVVGSFFKWIRLDLYEQCSDHITEKMPSSVRLGSRPMACSTRSYSSGESPCWATISGVIWLMPAGFRVQTHSPQPLTAGPLVVAATNSLLICRNREFFL